MESVQGALDGCLDFWPGVAEGRGVVWARWTTRCEAERGIDEFWIGAVCAPRWTRYLWGDGIIWDGGEENVEVFVRLTRVRGRGRGHRRVSRYAVSRESAFASQSTHAYCMLPTRRKSPV